MVIETLRSFYNQLYRKPTHCSRWVVLLGLWYLGGCSLQGFDYLSKGSASGSGGSEQSGGASNESNAGGTLSTGGATGESHAGGEFSKGGALNTGGMLGTGGVSTGATASFTVVPDDLIGCAFAQTGGTLLAPPSQGFESDISNWTTTAGNTAALKRMPGNGSNCEGDWYMNCTGSLRTGNWDGPALEVGSLVTLGHTYQMSVAVRQTSASASNAEVFVKLVVSVSCTTPVYQDIISKALSSKWVRVTGQFTLTAPAGCTAPTSVKLYVATLETVAPYVSFDVDDFKLIDLSPSGT